MKITAEKSRKPVKTVLQLLRRKNGTVVVENEKQYCSC
jgi:hypothetical protein